MKVVPEGLTRSFIYYDSPQILAITPLFGPVRSKTDEILEISGTNFKCPVEGCDLLCRFGKPPIAMYSKATRVSDTKVTCPIPKYAQPEIMDVELTLNGEDYTNNKH
ncbi:MAG: hypothetical protein COA94_09090 [Rickettsiales bacterium]|nr:MAG: hypothetical protein COA94_09090 [Rickettsiales bacterium]